jgi:hypothetical protein
MIAEAHWSMARMMWMTTMPDGSLLQRRSTVGQHICDGPCWAFWLSILAAICKQAENQFFSELQKLILAMLKEKSCGRTRT